MSIKILKIRDVVRKHEGFSEASLRWYVKNANQNGLHHAIRRIGKSIFIDEELFLMWLEGKKVKN